MTLSVYCNAFWPGFLEGTDPVTVNTFLELLSKALKTEVVLAAHPSSANILLESLFGASILHTRAWQYSVFFSGECRICPNYLEYDCVLWGEPTQGNVVCCPEFVPYLYSTGLKTVLEEVSAASGAGGSAPLPPLARVCVVISNPGGAQRNRFLDLLERYVPVDYAGRFRNNVPVVQASYTTEEFRRFVGQYRCILSMENSRGGDYVTEKITHGMLARTVPIYWGSKNVDRYFHSDRFIHVTDLDEESIGVAINEIFAMLHDDDAYRERIAQPIWVDASGQPGHRLHRTLDAIAADMRRVLLCE